MASCLEETLKITCGVSQGSVIDPTLWNVYYDGVWRYLSELESDLAILISQKTIQKEVANKTTPDITDWLKLLNGWLNIAPEKIKVEEM